MNIYSAFVIILNILFWKILIFLMCTAEQLPQIGQTQVSSGRSNFLYIYI